MTGTRHDVGTRDDALDARLSALTDPGEDPAFRARLLARLERTADGAGRPARAWRGLATAALLAAVVAGGVLAWRVLLPAGPDDTGATATAPGARAAATAGAPAVGRPPHTNAVAQAAGDSPSAAPANPLAPSARPARQGQNVRVRDVLTDEDPLPYGMERVRVAGIAIAPVTLPQVREDPTLGALTPPDPIRVDQIDIDPIAPRR